MRRKSKYVVLSLVLCLSMMLFLCGCGEEKQVLRSKNRDHRQVFAGRLFAAASKRWCRDGSRLCNSGEAGGR